MEHPAEELKALSGGGFDDVFVFAPVAAVAELGNAILGRDGCMNFFAGPMDKTFGAKVNLYDVHYNSTHLMGTTGGNTDDMIESLRLTADERIDPAVMITHIGGLDSAADTILNLPHIPGGKKLVYNHISMPMTAIDDFASLAKSDERFGELHAIVQAHNGLWCAGAEEYLLSHWN
jgi:threonine dehydrogenase-like Zn-dependent dehydrogenase